MAIVNPYNYTRPNATLGSGVEMNKLSKQKLSHSGTKQDAYLVQKVMTAKPQELTMMLYEGLVKFVKLAIYYLDKKDYEKVNTNAVKAQNIIEELMSTLNHDIAISAELDSLYAFIHTEVVNANINKSEEQFTSVLEFATELADTWREAMKKM